MNEKIKMYTRSIKVIIKKIIGMFYFFVFKKKIDDNIIKILMNMSYLALSTALGGGAIFLFNVLAGRLLGPAEYGNYSIIVSLANFMIIPMLMGFNLSVVRHLSEDNRDDLIVTTITSVLAFTLITSSVIFVMRGFLVNLLHIPLGVLLFAVIFSCFLTFYNLSKSILQALLRIKQYAMFESIYGVVTLLGFFVAFYFYRVNNFSAALVPQLIAYSVVVVFVVGGILKSIGKINFKRSHFSELFGYGYLVFLGGISAVVLGNISLFVVNYFNGAVVAGQYSAYYVTSMLIISQFVQIFTTIFFPIACKSNNKSAIFKQVNIIVGKSIFIVPLANFVIITVIMILFGHKYPYRVDIALIFSVNAALYVSYNIYSFLIAAEGRLGVRYMMFGTFYGAMINLISNFILVPHFAVMGAAISAAVTSLFMVIYYYSVSRRLFGGANRKGA